jgi:uncharacterized protein (TIGR03435 family)
MSLEVIISIAYGSEGGDRVVAADRAISKYFTEQFEIQALPPETASPPKREEILAMTRRLLAERFALKVRVDTELADGFVLRVVNPGVVGAGLRPAPEGCTKLPPRANPWDPKLAEAYQRSCVLTLFDDHLRGIMTLRDFARSLSSCADRPILDQTELTGTFAIDLRMSTASINPRSWGASQSSAPAFADALRDQMGLVARRERQPIRVFVVEHVEPLIEN